MCFYSFVTISVLSLYGLFIAMVVKSCHDVQKHDVWESDIQKACGSDFVYTITKVGALSKPECWKVLCYVGSENVYYERFVCTKE